MEQPTKKSETNAFPITEQVESEEFLSVEIGQLQRTPIVSESGDDHPKEVFETYDEFLARIKSWVDAAKEETQDASQFIILSNAEFTEMVEQDRRNCERNKPQRNHNRITKRKWQKRRKEIRKRREEQLKQLLKISSQSQQANLTSNPRPTISGTRQCSNFSSTGPSFDGARYTSNLSQFSQYRANKRKSCTESAATKSKKPRKESREDEPSTNSDSETTFSQSSEYDVDESSLENVSSMDDSGLSLMNDSELSLIDDLDMNLTYVWVNWNMPSPNEENLRNNSTSSDET